MIQIRAFAPEDAGQITDLVLGCQNDGTRPTVTVDDQPDLQDIAASYLAPGGGFWVAATEEGEIVGSIGVVNAGHGVGILKKFFVAQNYRGAPYHLGQQLYACLHHFAKEHAFAQLVLDTPKNTSRAHAFYQRAGWIQVEKDQLPVQYHQPYQESDFFLLKL